MRGGGGGRETENVAELATRENNSPAAATPLPAEARMESPATGAAPNRHHPPQSPGPARSPLLPVDYDISRRAGISLSLSPPPPPRFLELSPGSVSGPIGFQLILLPLLLIQ